MIERSRKTVGLVVGAAITGIGAAYLANSYIDRTLGEKEAALNAQYKLVEVVVPTRDLPRGAIIGKGNVAVRKVPRTFLHSDAIRPQHYGRYAGRRLLMPLRGGDQLLVSSVSESRATVFASMIPEGKRALTVPVDEVSSVSGMLAPGDSIDLLATMNAGDDARTFPLLRAVTIVAVGVNVGDGRNAGQNRYRTITVAVTPEEASRIVLAQDLARLTVVLRAAGDGNTDYEQTVTRAQLLGLDRPQLAGPAPSAQIIVGGR